MRTMTPLSGMSFWKILVQFGSAKMARCTSVPTLRASTSKGGNDIDVARQIAADFGVHQAGDAG